MSGANGSTTLYRADEVGYALQIKYSWNMAPVQEVLQMPNNTHADHAVLMRSKLVKLSTNLIHEMMRSPLQQDQHNGRIHTREILEAEQMEACTFRPQLTPHARPATAAPRRKGTAPSAHSLGGDGALHGHITVRLAPRAPYTPPPVIHSGRPVVC